MTYSAGRKAPFLTVLLATAALLAACEEQIDVRGNMPDPQAVSDIRPGQTTRAEVEDILGAPSAVATFEEEIWYYIGGRVKTVSFFQPEVLERNIITIRFNGTGVVESIDRQDATDQKNVAIVSRETPTRGKDLTVLQQIIGNLGRFGNPEDTRDAQPF
jgi:outer membrane protein assembly factor BamE (lipoprotein component of BamABCDE complex)